MRVFRIAKQARVQDLTGRGAEISGGRWNRKGVPCLYTSSSLAVCICEILVHTDTALPPSDMWYAEFLIPDSLVSQNHDVQALSADTVAAGTVWLSDCRSPALRVPSAVLPPDYTHDYNVILNPRHPAFPEVKLVRVSPCPFDRRLYPDKD